MKENWLLDPTIAFLNHGSFGATPKLVLAKQSEWRERMEREPVLFLARQIDELLEGVRQALATFLNADPNGIALVNNATAGINAVLRSLDLDQHDELLVTNHEYNASRNTLDFAAALAGSKVVVVDIPFPIASPDVVVERVLEKVTNRTRLLLIDHVTSQTGLVFPVERIVAELNARGVDTLIDGAHAPGMLELDLRAINAAYYTGNLHKWVCAPKGAAFLYVRENRRATVRPTSISHGATSDRRDRSRYLIEFDWTGTDDPTALLSAPESLRVMASLVDGGWPEIRRRNRALALQARDILIDALQIEKPAPDEMIGSLAAVPIPDSPYATHSLFGNDPIQEILFDKYRIEVPVMLWPQAPKRVLRVSAQLYNETAEYGRLADALRDEIARER
ncbi:MAG TPA: aminotransferase class V-fold PLP-dependent enzyme [Thermoanaerobaculia bacterium]|jgi:isopenicillin-N epimerase|nr:aminotransferase class V-fold PLP-dependent enzyme [Thermoanaerobaculia bacterium]